MAHTDFLARQPREGLIGKIRVGELLQNLPRIGAGQHEDAEARGDGVQPYRAVGRAELAQRIMVMPLICTGGYEVEAPRSPFIDRELSAHAAPWCQEMTQRNAALLLRDLVGENGFEPVAGTRTRHFHLGEGRHVLDRHVTHHVAAFLAHEGDVVGAAE